MLGSSLYVGLHELTGRVLSPLKQPICLSAVQILPRGPATSQPSNLSRTETPTLSHSKSLIHYPDLEMGAVHAVTDGTLW